MAGGAGNDTYVVDDIRDRVIEKVDGGVEDTILTDLKSFALDDDAPPTGAPVSNDTSSPLVLEEAASTSAISLAPTSDETSDDASEVNSILADFGRGANVENLTYIGDGSFSGIGNSSNNVLSGGRSNDKLWGGGGDDVLYGSDGDDTLDGGSGNDALFGGIGDDRFDGGGGDDVLYVSSRGPGYGHDTIVLRPGFGSDVVIGFDANESCSKGHDRLDVSAYASLTADSIGAEIQIIASGPHTIITINGDSLTLLDVNANAIGKDDFIFS
jgi:Ca2+-binding RTX toxin-like protein